jgi:hypothetical protein
LTKMKPTTFNFDFPEFFSSPTKERCSKFSDYLLETYVDENSKYPPTMWASNPCSTAKRINNGPECFHSHFNDQFYSKFQPH